MRYVVQAFLVLILVIHPFAGYAQKPEAQSAPSVSGVSSQSTSETSEATENKPTQPATAASQYSSPQAQQAPDSSAVAPVSANTTKAKRKRFHLSGVDIGILVGSGILLFILFNMDRG